MLISHKYKFIFIKTRKTAGTSIEVVLDRLMGEDDVVTKVFPNEPLHRPRNYSHDKGEFYNHIPAVDVKTICGSDIFDGYFKFCVEREPVDKCISHFFMLKNSPFHNGASSGLTWDNYLETKDFPVDLGSYTDGHGRLLVDKIIRYEALESELLEVFRKLEIPCSELTVRAKAEFRESYLKVSDIPYVQKEAIYLAFKDSLRYTGYSLKGYHSHA